jgi:pimeloyl-ACP methyl ester carboxylesterase
LPLVKNLTESVALPDGTSVSFDVIIPSLPGFAFSQAAPANWTVDDTGRIMNSLMVDVLGYDKYAVHGTDWGSAVAYSMYDRFSAHVKASHFVFVPFFPKDPAGLAALNITLDELETFEESQFLTWATTGQGYYIELSTEPNTIGLSLYDNPVGQLAFIGQKFIIWSDPRQGTLPSQMTHNEILRSVSLYYLTQTIVSSGFIYAQNPNGFKVNYTRAQTDAPLLFSTFKYNVGFWPPELVAKIGNLVSYKSKSSDSRTTMSQIC